ncbi:MAG: aldolase [Lentisphaerae bacterium]|jgi:4-hydroxy-2-oxoheptanedioate aldolase|nr:aldolase [Lentisphaerota bacterium]
MQTEWKMRESRVLRKLRNGEVALCTKMNLADPRVAEIIAMSGFDCIWTCQEHIGNDYRTIQELILGAKAYDCDIVCRVQKGCYSDYILPLEMDASGIMVPHLMSLQEAKQTVNMTRFHPQGRRPLDGGNADGKYCRVPVKDYLEQSNRERFVIFQIEDPEPLEELEEIAALDGYDMLFFGPGDFSHSIGDPGNFSNPVLLETCKRIAEVATRHGKFAGTVGSLGNYLELVKMGYRFINIGSDVTTLAATYTEIVHSVAGIAINSPETKTPYAK